MAFSRTVFTIALICSLAVFVFAQFDEGGCDGLGGVVDKCGVCNGNNDCLNKKKNGKPVFVEDEVEIEVRQIVDGCDGNGGAYDECGECNGDGSSCSPWCDGLANSGLTYDNCGVCGGNDECFTCDGAGGSYDACGICNGDGTTCGGCDGKGSQLDGCNVCDGDNSTCMCVKYHGFKTDVLEYMLVQYTIDQTLWKIQHVLDTLILIMEDLEEYNGPADLGVLIHYLNEFCADCLDNYSYSLDKFTYEVKQSIGIESENLPFPGTM